MERRNFNPRKLMEIAIEVMRQSVNEPRSDGKVSPLVGAVLWKPDGTVETACRGELRYGDHAEFTLLERKNRQNKLDDSVLFATLEPCAPGARNHPKLGCAERIVNARIKEVWIGIEDPDPTVDRKGIKFLQDNSVEVHMFERDLQEEIQRLNEEFISQAMDRASVASQEPVILSELENTQNSTSLVDDFSEVALRRYRDSANIASEVGTPQFNQRLIQQGLILEQNKIFIPTGFGLLLFGREPRNILPQAGLLGTVDYKDGREEPRDFDGPAIFVPEQALQWTRDKLANPIDRGQAQRREVNQQVYELAREGIVNALVHRDYGIEGAKCQLKISANTIVIKSPGQPVKPITIEQIQSFEAPMLSRNPVLHYVFAKMKLAEERGLGLKSMRELARSSGLPTPVYSWEAPYLVLTIYLNSESAIQALDPSILQSLASAEREGWKWLVTQDRVKTSQYVKALDVPNRTALNHLKKLTELGLLKKVGSGPTTQYEVIRS